MISLQAANIELVLLVVFTAGKVSYNLLEKGQYVTVGTKNGHSDDDFLGQ